MSNFDKIKKLFGVKKEKIFLNEIPFKEGDEYYCYNLFFAKKKIKIDLIRKDGTVVLDIEEEYKLIVKPKKIQIQ